MRNPARLYERQALLSAAETPAVFKTAGTLAVATALLSAAVLLLRYGDQAEIWALLVQTASLTAVAALGGILLRLEQHLQIRYERVPTVLFFPAVFVAFAAGLAVVYPGAPSYLETRRLTTISPVMPVIVLTVLTALYGGAYRAAFFALLPRLTHTDYIRYLSSPQFADQFRIYWDAAVRYGDPVSLMMMRSVPRSGDTPSDLDTAARELERSIRPHLRRSDRCGRYARDTVWVVFARTNAALAEIPVRRVLESIRRDDQLQRRLEHCNALARCGVASYQRRMQSPQDLADAALAAVQEATRKERELQFHK